MDNLDFTASAAPCGDGLYIPPVETLAPAGDGEHRDGWPTWGELLEVDPELGHLERVARRLGPLERDWLGLKTRVTLKAGWYAPGGTHPLLRTSEAYQALLWHLRGVYETSHAGRRRRVGR